MVSAKFSEGISEVLDILNYMDKSYVDKIPKKFKEFLEKNKSDSYIPNLDHSKKINEMNLKEKSKDILAILYMNYWCNSEQKAEYIDLIKQNEENYLKELREKYNPDDLFKNKTQATIQPSQSVQNNVYLVEIKESFFTKFIKKLKDIFHIK